MKETNRQLVHMLFGASVIALALLGKEIALAALFACFFIGIFLTHFKITGGKNRAIDWVMNTFEREDAQPAKGALMYCVGLLFLFSFSRSLNFALAATAILAFGDGFATLIGVRGRHALPLNKKKSWEGLTAFFVSGFAGASLFIGFLPAFIYSLVLAIIESIDFRVDDNLLIPLAALLLKALTQL